MSECSQTLGLGPVGDSPCFHGLGIDLFSQNNQHHHGQHGLKFRFFLPSPWLPWLRQPVGEGQAVAAPQEYEEEYDDDLEDGGFVDHDPEELDYDCAQGGPANPGGTKRAMAEAPTPARSKRHKNP